MRSVRMQLQRCFQRAPTPVCVLPTTRRWRRCSTVTHRRSAGRLQAKNEFLVEAPSLPVSEPASGPPSSRVSSKEVTFISLQDGYYTVQGRLEPQAPADLVYGILTDYTASSRIFGNVLESNVEYTPSGELQTVQTCRWNFLAFSGSFQTKLLVEEDQANLTLVFRLAESSFMNGFEGRWQVTPQQDGGCRVQHVLSVKPFVSLPAPIAHYTRGIFVQQVEVLLDDLQAEIQRRVSEIGQL